MAQLHVLVFILSKSNGITFGIIIIHNTEFCACVCNRFYIVKCQCNFIKSMQLIFDSPQNCCDVNCQIHLKSMLCSPYEICHNRFTLEFYFRYENIEILTMSKFNHETSFIVEMKCCTPGASDITKHTKHIGHFW